MFEAVIAAISVKEGEEKALANAVREMENYWKRGDRCGEVRSARHRLI